MTNLLSLAKEVLSDVNNPDIRQALITSLECSADQFNTIEYSFKTHTSDNHSHLHRVYDVDLSATAVYCTTQCIAV